MVKKSLSVLLTLAILATLLVPAMGVSANVETVDITDYTPVMPEGINIGTIYNTGTTYGTSLTGVATNTWRITAAASQTTVPSDYANPMGGAYWTPPYAEFTTDTNYVISFNARNKSPEGTTANAVYGIFDGSMGGEAAGWGWKGQYVWADEVSSSDWTKVARTFTLGHNGTGSATSSNIRFKIGLGTGNTFSQFAGKDNFDFRPNASLDIDISTIYLAKEAAYDVVNTISMTKVMPGAVVSGSAKVINQVGDKGNLDQNITYFVTDPEGNVVEGVSVVAGTNGSYTATVDANAEDGDYVITARAAAYNTTENFMQHSVTLTVEDVDYSDASVAPVTANLTQESGVNSYGVDVTTSGNIYTLTAGETQATKPAGIARPVGGFYWIFTDGTQGEKYIFTFKVKKNETATDTPNLIFGFGDSSMGGTAAGWGWTMQTYYVQDITSTEWQTIVQEIILPYNTGASSTIAVLGLGAGSTSQGWPDRTDDDFRPGASMIIDMDSFGVYKAGVSEVKNEALTSTNVFAGGTIEAKAEVVNAVGTKGDLDQTMEYIVLDSDTRKVMASDITITTGADGNYTINVGEDAAAGNYVAVASNTTNGTTVRTGLEFSVETIDKYLTEYAHGEKPKKIFAALSGTSNTTGLPANGITEYRENGSITNADFDYSLFAHAAQFWGGLHGYRIDIPAADPSSYSVREGDAYVFEMKVKNTSEEGITPKFGFSLASVQDTYNTQAISVAMEEITERDTHQTIKGVLTARADSGLGVTSRISIGMPWNNTRWFDSADHALLTEVKNAKVNIDYGSIYVAKEIFYDVDVTANKQVARSGGSIVLDAAALNQIGLEGALDQNFSWVALNAAKTDIAEGITITPVAGDTSKVNVAFDRDVKEGNYVIAAYSEDYNAARSMTITVSNTTSFENVAIDRDTKTVTFDATNVADAGFKGAVYVAEYVADTFVKAEKLPITLASGDTKGEEVTYTIDIAETNEIRVYFWDNDLTPYGRPVSKKDN